MHIYGAYIHIYIYIYIHTMERSIHIYIHIYIYYRDAALTVFSFSIERAKSYSECARCYTRVSRAFIRCVPSCLCVCLCVWGAVRKVRRGRRVAGQRQSSCSMLVSTEARIVLVSRPCHDRVSEWRPSRWQWRPLSPQRFLKSFIRLHELNLVRKIDNRNISHALKIVLSLKIEYFEN